MTTEQLKGPEDTAVKQPTQETSNIDVSALQRELESIKSEMAANRATIQAQRDVIQTVEKKKTPYEMIADKIYIDPEAALKEHADLIRSEIRAEVDTREVQRKFWDDFYRKNPKLKAVDFAIQDHVSANLNSWKTTPLDEVAKKIEDYGKKIVSGVSSINGQEDTLNRSSGVTFPSMGGVSVENPNKTTNDSFLDQINSLKKKK